MSTDGESASLDLKQFLAELGMVSPSSLEETESQSAVRDPPAFYDFPTYEVLFDLSAGYTSLSEDGTAFLDGILRLNVLSLEQFQRLRSVLEVAEATIRCVAAGYFPPDEAYAVAGRLTHSFYFSGFVNVPSGAQVALAISHARSAPQTGARLRRFIEMAVERFMLSKNFLYPPNWPGFWENFGFDVLTDLVTIANDPRFSWDRYWSRLGELAHDALAAPGELPFEAAPSRSVNLGLRLVYRQNWRPLADQAGEVVRTIPLGPGQTERVTTKVVRRTTHSTTVAEESQRETTSERSTATKDSREIVQEATRSNTVNLFAEAEAHGGFAGFGASVRGGVSDTTTVGASSRDHSARLGESMQKAANSLRQSSKITVATQMEESTETERFSEIRNANAEVAVTYEFSTLQRQYDVFTRLAEVQPVVLVAERVPAQSEINRGWVRRHATAIQKALIDDSFRQGLSDAIADEGEDPTGMAEEARIGAEEDRYGLTYEAARSQLAQFTGEFKTLGGSLALPDVYGTPQRIYESYLQSRRGRNEVRTQQRLRVERLLEHIWQNVLHYARAIWTSEDAESRLSRYRMERRVVPVEWLGPLTALAGNRSSPVSMAAGFQPTGKEMPLWRLIEPSQPIGYLLNYLVFPLRLPAGNDGLVPDAQGHVLIGLELLFDEMREPYVDANTWLLTDPARSYFATRVASRVDMAAVQRIDNSAVYDFLSYLPHLESIHLDSKKQVLRAGDALATPILPSDWAEYLYRKNNTRRFLVQTDNLYLNIRGAMEPFKRAHRYLDVLRTATALSTENLKNERRKSALTAPNLLSLDPDIAKVIVVGGQNSMAAAAEAFGR